MKIIRQQRWSASYLGALESSGRRRGILGGFSSSAFTGGVEQSALLEEPPAGGISSCCDWDWGCDRCAPCPESAPDSLHFLELSDIAGK